MGRMTSAFAAMFSMIESRLNSLEADKVNRQETGLALMAISTIPIAYSLGLLDWLGGIVNPPPGPPPPNPHGNLALRIARRADGSPVQYCAVLVGIENDSGTLLATLPNGSPAPGAHIFGAIAQSPVAPPQSAFAYLGATDAQGFFGYVWNSASSGYFYARDPRDFYGQSNLEKVC